MDGHHHLSLRKRLFKKLEPYPNPDALKAFLDKIMLWVALAGPVAMLPQVYQAFAAQDARGLSLITWVLWTLISIIWILYGLVHKETPIVISNVIYAFLNFSIIIAIFLYS